MATKTIDLIASGLEQGSIGSSGNVSNNDRVRTTGYIDLDSLRLVSRTTAVLSAQTSVSGKTPQVDFMGYDSNKALLCDLYWYNSPYTVNLSSYSGLRYVRAVFTYSDGSHMSVSDITSANLVVTGAERDWYLDANNQLNRESLADEIQGSILTPPYPASFWQLNSDNKLDMLLLPEEIQGNILTPPYPASFWYLDTDSRINMQLLPEIVPGSSLEPPYPASFWYLDTEWGCLRTAIQPKPLPLGGFANCRRLEYIKTPASIKIYGPEAFIDTNLIEVTIARDSTYSEHTFPPGCQVKYYSD